MLSAALFLIAAAQAPMPAATATPAPEKRVCKKIVPTGSIMAKRFCLTKTEWARLDQTTGADAENALRRRTGGTCQSNCPW